MSQVNVGFTPDRSRAVDFRSRVRRSISEAQQYLFSIQYEDGHWCGELEGDTILESEYVLAMHFIGRLSDPKVRKACNYIRHKQMPVGGWGIYPGGPADVSASVKAYFVLKLAGDDPNAAHMRRARRAILELGGIDACNSFTKIYLSIFGQYDWKRCPMVPPELILLPRWFYINVYEMSSWSRAILIPLSLIRVRQPECKVPARANLHELISPLPRPATRSFWHALFHGIDAGLKLVERMPFRPAREIATRRAERWILDRLEDSDGLGAIFPPIVNTIFALRSLGYPIDHPTIQQQVRELEKLEIEEDDTLRVQPCFSPVWDTAIAVNALVESGVAPDDPRILQGARWLLDRRGHDRGDWTVKNGTVKRSGWYFEYANPFYPDCDTTSQVITALQKVTPPDGPEATRCQRAVFESHHWHASMQNDDGGWGAFDRNCDKEILCYVPFADHNAMIDPSTADLTARGLEMLSTLGFDRDYAPARRAIDYLLGEQEDDGSWFGRWGCNYLYGTWLALWGLKCVGADMSSPWARRAATWIRDCQNPDGGWGESPQSYEDNTRKAAGPSTASQTAWALLGLIAAGDGDSDAARRGVDYLLAHQLDSGAWQEDAWTGTGFPGVFYLRYHLYPVYFPLLALGCYDRSDGQPRLRLVSQTGRRAAEAIG